MAVLNSSSKTQNTKGVHRVLASVPVMERSLRHIVPAPIRRRMRVVIDGVADQLHPNIPPRRLRRHISPLWLDFKSSGNDQLEFCIELAWLESSQRVLDLACGVGRFALPLTQYLTAQGTYEGLDPFAEGITWCRDHITRKHPNFHFTVADVATPDDRTRSYTAANYRFPYDAQTFDFVYAGSLFTHLTEAGARNYLHQVAAVLKSGGRFVCTWLLFNSQSAKLLTGRSMERIWNSNCGTHRVIGQQEPEVSVLYDEASVRRWYADAGLGIIEPIRIDATYCPSRIPKDRGQGMHLYYAHSIIALRA